MFFFFGNIFASFILSIFTILYLLKENEIKKINFLNRSVSLANIPGYWFEMVEMVSNIWKIHHHHHARMQEKGDSIHIKKKSIFISMRISFRRGERRRKKTLSNFTYSWTCTKSPLICPASKASEWNEKRGRERKKEKKIECFAFH